MLRMLIPAWLCLTLSLVVTGLWADQSKAKVKPCVVESTATTNLCLTAHAPDPSSLQTSSAGDAVNTAGVIEVGAPYDARHVSVYFPSGLQKDLSYDDGRQLWRGRLPQNLQRELGHSKAMLIAVERLDGQQSYQWQRLQPEALVEPFFALFEDDATVAGALVRLAVDTVEPASSVVVHCPALGWDHELLEWRSGTMGVDWAGRLAVVGDAPARPHLVRIVVQDLAGERHERWLPLVVVQEG